MTRKHPVLRDGIFLPLRIERADHERLKAEAKAQGVSLSVHTRRLLGCLTPGGASVVADRIPECRKTKNR